MQLTIWKTALLLQKLQPEYAAVLYLFENSR